MQLQAVLSFLLVLAGSALGQRPVSADLNNLIDQQMEVHNRILTERHLEDLPIGGWTTDGVVFSNGKQHYANTLQRTGDGVATRGPAGSTSYHYPIGWAKLAFTFDKITFLDGKEVINAQLKVPGVNRIRFDFTVKDEGTAKCKVSLDEYKFEKMEGLQAENGLLTDEQLVRLSSLLMGHMNSVLALKKPAVEKHLQAICNPPASWPHTKHQ